MLLIHLQTCACKDSIQECLSSPNILEPLKGCPTLGEALRALVHHPPLHFSTPTCHHREQYPNRSQCGVGCTHASTQRICDQEFLLSIPPSVLGDPQAPVSAR